MRGRRIFGRFVPEMRNQSALKAFFVATDETLMKPSADSEGISCANQRYLWLPRTMASFRIFLSVFHPWLFNTSFIGGFVS
jgi:hypothetical protein